jgi:hypothetical protein
MNLRRIRRLLDWRSALVYTHRWLGIAGCVLFVAWFFSGIVMMYARMPSLAGEEKLARAVPLDLSTVTITPAEAAKAAGIRASGVRVSMLQDRPVYQFSSGDGRRQGGNRSARTPIVFADTGAGFKGVTADEAREAARRFEPAYTGPLYQDYLTEPDQWTLGSRNTLPLYRFTLDDAAATQVYVSEATGEVVLRTTRRERFWGYLGPVTHWVYIVPLKQRNSVWSEFIIWSSLVGCVMCVSGLVWGLLRFSPAARFRIRRQHAHSPYVGMMKWHHYTGLFFGVISLTWVYSGLLSMGPFDWFQPTGGRGREARSGGGGAAALGAVSLERLRAAHATLATEFTPKSLELMQIQGEAYWAADRPPAEGDADAWRSPSLMPREHKPELERRYVSVTSPESGSFATFPTESMMEVAQAAMPGVPVADAVWLNEYDSYYYSSGRPKALPVLRVRYADAQKTWLYLDPGRGGIVQRNEEVTRLRRWLYQGLHSLDFPFLYYKRPLWDIVVILLSIGGLVLSATTLTPAGRRLMRHLRGWAPAMRRPSPAASTPRRQPLET